MTTAGGNGCQEGGHHDIDDDEDFVAQDDADQYHDEWSIWRTLSVHDSTIQLLMDVVHDINPVIVFADLLTLYNLVSIY